MVDNCGAAVNATTVFVNTGATLVVPFNADVKKRQILVDSFLIFLLFLTFRESFSIFIQVN